MLDAGKVTFCDLTDTSADGGMPKNVLKPVYPCMFENRIVGYNRRYAALGVNQEISALIRIWRPPLRADRTPSVDIGMYAVIEESELDGQYRVEVVQPLVNFDGINVTDVTLEKLEENYDVLPYDGGGDDPGSCDHETYSGPYEVTPAVQEQSLQTNQKLMKDDVTVYEIPYAETSNDHGTTVVIAS